MNKKIFSIVLIIATLFMGVGYASINAISLDISGEVIAQVQDGIFITNIKYNEELSNNVLVDDSKINSAYQTNLDSSITLNSSDSVFSYDITVYNSSDISYYFNEVDYTLGSDTYSNSNITFRLEGLNDNDVIVAGDYKTFSIVFYYLDSTNITSNVLNSVLNFKFWDYPCPKDGTVCDISGNNYHATTVGANWDRDNKVISFDGIDDYMYLNNLAWGDTTEFTVDFVAKVHYREEDSILFETSLNSNEYYGSFYIDTNEFGDNEITLAMKYPDKSNSANSKINHKYVNNIIDNNNFRHYTVTFNSLNDLTNFTRIYYEGVYQTTTTHPPKNGDGNRYDGDITGNKLVDYEFYVASRAGESYFCPMELKAVRIYNKALSDEEVMSNHNGKIVRDNLLVYWDFR